MAGVMETIGELLSRLAVLLRLKPSESQRFDKMEQSLASNKAANIDKMEALKDRIRQFEAQALRKKSEYEQAKGDSKRIVGREIEQLFRDMDRLRGQEDVLSQNIERISLAQAKLEEYKAAVMKGLEEDALDDLALDLQQAFEELKVADRASRDLQKVEYKAPERNRVDTEKRMAEVAGEHETTTGLSPETEKRLKVLEAEET